MSTMQLVIETACVADIVSGTVTSPKGGRTGTTVGTAESTNRNSGTAVGSFLGSDAAWGRSWIGLAIEAVGVTILLSSRGDRPGRSVGPRGYRGSFMLRVGGAGIVVGKRRDGGVQRGS